MIRFLGLIRPFNCILAAIAVLIGGIIAGGFGIFESFNIYIAIVTGFIIMGAGNSLNDYFDAESDKINRSKKPIPSGRISRKSALTFSIILFIIGIILAGIINFVAFLIVIINSFLLILYSSCLQNRIFIGNAVLGFLVATTLLFGWASLGRAINIIPIIVLMILAGFATLSREIVKDLEDIEGDRKSYIKRLKKKVKRTIAEKLGLSRHKKEVKINTKRYKIISGLALIIAVLFSLLPYLIGMYGLGYLILVLITDLLFLISIGMLFKANSPKHFHRISKWIKTGMFIGLIAFILGAL